MINRMHHTGFVVADMEKAVEFYRDVVGLKVEKQYERTGAPIDQVVGYEGTHISIALLTAGGGHILELIQYLNPLPAPRPTSERSVIGASHVCFQVDDIEKAFQRLKKGGATIMNPPAEITPGRVACYLRDPDGNWVELLQADE